MMNNYFIILVSCILITAFVCTVEAVSSTCSSHVGTLGHARADACRQTHTEHTKMNMCGKIKIQKAVTIIPISVLDKRVIKLASGN
jgi:hypothetical protein